ncbi:hypothetical protein, partial [Membranihabitans marinus]|uniref:hypothetical protein n=1 Tax=Membranihabitans marinus TaxID=1227546 RepID=UPI001F31B93A
HDTVVVVPSPLIHLGSMVLRTLLGHARSFLNKESVTKDISVITPYYLLIRNEISYRFSLVI